ncbi:MAG: hypothetical protein IPM25_06365 [Chloracidobacterium sp.]|nr:hypothetical protein [Chloracidobacterium sp.]
MDLEQQLGQAGVGRPSFVNIDDEWRSATGSGVRVAIVDSGIDVSHPGASRAVSSARSRRGSKAAASFSIHRPRAIRPATGPLVQA